MRQPGAYSGIASAAGRSHVLPLARIKKIMKRSVSGEQGQGDNNTRMMISGEAPIVLAKACEQFIEELTKRSWISASSQGKRRTLQKEDVASAVQATDLFDFLIHLISSNQQHQHHELNQYVSDI
ncbi:nuclear transcription factor Y subunit C-2-like [Impatiens glandulifera]|uniref:nuclear transcription factor Y subunit C-2-like n=1 Tax=Impatiens glandulifera TaxID=253017 RepID=UPI001FB0D210|nr:nuclear transcription factor Y subunit C-2-like [Impatiens glandulifera]